MRARFLILLGLALATSPTQARKWEVHPDPCPVSPAAQPFEPEEGVRPINGGPQWSIGAAEDIYVEAPGFGPAFRRAYGPVYLRINPEAFSAPAAEPACETDGAPQ